MDTYDMLQVCQAYARLGGAVQDQLETVLNNDLDTAMEAGELNMNAVAMIHEFLTDVAQYVDDDDHEECASMAEQLDEWAKDNGGEFRYGRWVPGPDARVGELGL